MSVQLTPAKAHNAKGKSVYQGPRIGHYDFDVIRDVAFTGDFEAVVSFGISLRRKENFRVFVLHNPNRLVIDVHH
jgi:AMIN domain